MGDRESTARGVRVGLAAFYLTITRDWERLERTSADEWMRRASGERAYEVHVEPFAERVRLPRSGRREALTELCQRYADRLAARCIRAPYQWFNFYEFFEDDAQDAGQ